VTFGLTLVPLPTHRVEVRAGGLAYHDVRPSGEERGTAVLVPGYTGSKEDFALLAAPLTEAGWRYVALDQRGQYESSGSDDPAAYTVEALATDLLDFLAAVAPGAHVVGHSFGGLVARAAAIREPAAFASLTLLDSGPAALTGPPVDRIRALAPLLDTYGPERLFEGLLAAATVSPGEEVVAFLRRRFLTSSVTGLRAMADAITGEPDRTEELRATGVRVLVASGEHDDTWLPDVQRDMAERLGAPFALIPGAVHSPAAERPAETARLLLEWWA
jgi:pimeloyl-ACP methyl ester carboxylesterase